MTSPRALYLSLLTERFTPYRRGETPEPRPIDGQERCLGCGHLVRGDRPCPICTARRLRRANNRRTA